MAAALSVHRLPFPGRSASSALGALGRPLPADVLERQDLHLVVPEGGLVVVLLGGGLRVHYVGCLKVMLLQSALQNERSLNNAIRKGQKGPYPRLALAAAAVAAELVGQKVASHVALHARAVALEHGVTHRALDVPGAGRVAGEMRDGERVGDVPSA